MTPLAICILAGLLIRAELTNRRLTAVLARAKHRAEFFANWARIAVEKKVETEDAYAELRIERDAFAKEAERMRWS